LIAAHQEGLREGPVHIVNRDQQAVVVLSVNDQRALCQPRSGQQGCMTALPPAGRRSNAQIDQRLRIYGAW
jgi:hypothetical protein